MKRKCLRKKCDVQFEPNKPKQLFCSAKCRVYHSREKVVEVVESAPKPKPKVKKQKEAPKQVADKKEENKSGEDYVKALLAEIELSKQLKSE